MSAETTGQKIRRARLSRRMTQRALARALGVPAVMVWRWEHDRKLPSRRYALQIESALGLRDLDSRERGCNAVPQTRAATGLGVQIRSARSRAGLTQSSLAQALGVDPSTVSHWERGQSLPRPEALERLWALLE
jgi:transcriptional regulator with XRE-family HTH domain